MTESQLLEQDTATPIIDRPYLLKKPANMMLELGTMPAGERSTGPIRGKELFPGTGNRRHFGIND